MNETFCRAVREYPELVDALRARAHELQLNWSELDLIAGNCSGWSSKALSRTGRKVFGMKSLGPTLEALGLRILVIEDERARDRTLQRRIPCNRSMQRVALEAHARRRDRSSDRSEGTGARSQPPCVKATPEPTIVL